MTMSQRERIRNMLAQFTDEPPTEREVEDAVAGMIHRAEFDGVSVEEVIDYTECTLEDA